MTQQDPPCWRTLMHRLIERSDLEDHMDLLSNWIIPRIEAKIQALKHELQGATAGSSNDASLLQTPLVIEVEKVAMLLWLRGRDGLLPRRECILAIEWLLLAWLEQDEAMRMTMFAQEGSTERDAAGLFHFWTVAQDLLQAWRGEGVVVWTATPTGRERELDAHKLRSAELMTLLRYRFVLWNC